MKTLILGAGYATRLGDLTKDRPKPLLHIAGRPIVDYILDQVERQPEMTEVYVVTNARFASHFTEWAARQIRRLPITIIDDGTTSDSNKLGALGDILFTVQQQGIADDLFVIAGDNLFDFDLRPFFMAFHQRGSTVGLYDVGRLDLMPQYSEVQLAPDGRIARFVEKPQHPSTTFMGIAVYCYRAEHLALLHRYRAEGNNMDSPGYFPGWLCSRGAVYGHIFRGRWFDIGRPEQYHEANLVWTERLQWA
ncbi:MAG: nucleotidyltransferase family protein [Chloroflexi bacterium]|nr:nucleotidyltransferase family protein [Chloroflexota bacterium]